jgi:hypothetical protein
VAARGDRVPVDDFVRSVLTDPKRSVVTSRLRLLLPIQEFLNGNRAKHFLSSHLDVTRAATLAEPTVQRLDVYPLSGGRFFYRKQSFQTQLVLRTATSSNFRGLLSRQN